jgi:hypothetical protein
LLRAFWDSQNIKLPYSAAYTKPCLQSNVWPAENLPKWWSNKNFYRFLRYRGEGQIPDRTSRFRWKPGYYPAGTNLPEASLPSEQAIIHSNPENSWARSGP